MARTHERVVALVLAIIFFATSIGVGVLVVWQATQESKESETTLQDEPKPKTQLAGTLLADFTPVEKIDKLQAIDTQVGTGAEVKAGDTVTVDYTGALAASGKIFQSSLDRGQTATFALGGVIPGWRDGMVGMKVGGKRRLLIPSAQGYGSTPQNDIPANSDLVFDITLHSIGE